MFWATLVINANTGLEILAQQIASSARLSAMTVKSLTVGCQLLFN
jgi:hypothetical protein